MLLSATAISLNCSQLLLVYYAAHSHCCGCRCSVGHLCCSQPLLVHPSSLSHCSGCFPPLSGSSVLLLITAAGLSPPSCIYLLLSGLCSHDTGSTQVSGWVTGPPLSRSTSQPIHLSVGPYLRWANSQFGQISARLPFSWATSQLGHLSPLCYSLSTSSFF